MLRCRLLLQAEQLDKEATAFEKHSAELKAKQDAHFANLKSAEESGLAKSNFNGGVPDTSKGTKVGAWPAVDEMPRFHAVPAAGIAAASR